MKTSKQSMIGVSLIEAILALGIAGAILMMGLRLYETFNADLSAQRMKYNVEEIIRAAAYYYYANCKLQSGTTNTATLDPNNSPAPPNPYTAVTVTTLVNAGYLMKAPAKNPLVDSSGTDGGYLIQFDMEKSDRNYCTNNGTSCNKIGNNYNWRIQVSVILKNKNLASRYFNMAGATCLTSIKGANTVTTCKDNATFVSTCQTLMAGNRKQRQQATANGCYIGGGTFSNYLSWERLPSMASPKGQSTMWLTNPVIKQFKQSQESPALEDMLASPDSTNFLCGS